MGCCLATLEASSTPGQSVIRPYLTSLTTFDRLYRPEAMRCTGLCFVYGSCRVLDAKVGKVRVVVTPRFSLDFSALTAPGPVCRIAGVGCAQSCYFWLRSGIRLRREQGPADSMRSTFCQTAWQLWVPGQAAWHNSGPLNLHGTKARGSRKMSAMKNKTTGVV